MHLYRVCREGAAGDTSPASEQLKQIGTMIDRLAFPLNVAAGIEACGFSAGEPEAVVSARSREVYDGIVDELRAKFADWKLPVPGESSMA